MKTVHVAAAVIRKGDQVFATQIGYGEFKDRWEFPGGKIELHESAEEALAREIKEELDAEINIGKKIGTVEYDYSDFHLSMECFWCEMISQHMVLKEHEAAKWLSEEELDSITWLPADKTILEEIKKGLK